jgi:murein DD-endopeptidase MepM/ murein hydrolase activator NlpD
LRASADAGITPESLKNSQNMDLLEAHVSFLSIRDDKGSKTKEEPLDADVSLVVSNNALLSTTSPTEALGVGGNEFSSFEDEISIYVVHKGDTVQIVADLFGVSPDTIYSANDMKKGDKLKEGDVLLILPFSGIEHTVAKGDTLQGIASKYKTDIDDILNANDIEEGAKLSIGDKLMIPGANLLSETKTKSTSGGSKGGYSNMPSVAGYFKNPVPGGVKTRGVKPGHKGVDIAAPTGTPIHAAAEGTVLIARNGWNGGFGNYVVMQHPNGVKTLYAHMSRLGTTPGAKVSQGEIIGYVGSTGHSTGPHLHFETLGSKNPF